VEHLRKPLRDGLRLVYDGHDDSVTLEELLQRAIILEIRSMQEPEGPAQQPPHRTGWYQRSRTTQPEIHASLGGSATKPGIPVAVTTNTHQKPSRRGRPGRDGRIHCYNCGKIGHLSQECRTPRKPCENCSQQVHYAQICERICPYCNQPRHRFATCPANPNVSNSSTATAAAVFPDEHDQFDPVQRQPISLLPFVLAGMTPNQLVDAVITASVTVSGVSERLLAGLDTMTAANLVTVDVIRKIKPVPICHPSTVVLRGLRGTVQSQGWTTVVIQFPGFSSQPVECEIAPDLPEPLGIILGFQWLKQHSAVITLTPTTRQVDLASLTLCASSTDRGPLP